MNWPSTAVLAVFFQIIALAKSARLPDPPVFAAVQHYPSICYLPPDSGLCLTTKTPQNSEEKSDDKSEFQTRYYFDVTTEDCYPFAVQNCGGNENRFSSLTDCQEICRIK
uniref:BPTI/Kunitz inhibitor domain-containing protein n=1 Tax=Acrobeloides nanus TaxID=290746 RepID=A0A914CWM4_9BILA